VARTKWSRASSDSYSARYCATIASRLKRSVAARRAAVQAGSTVELVHDAASAVRGADVLYTDVWTSMGQEAEREQRLHDFEGFRIDADLVARAKPEAIVLHCLPAHYGEEITEEVAYGPQSALWDQAENRMHTEKALLALLVR
jgi:ornithine carbamoyltransferase